MKSELMAVEKMVVENLYGVLPGDRPIIQNRGVGEMPTSHKMTVSDKLKELCTEKFYGTKAYKLSLYMGRP